MAEQVTDTFELVGRAVAEKFGISRVVAAGGFGVVYAGVHIGLDVPIAVKVLRVPPELAPEARKHFVDTFVLEAKTIARLKHPAIVQVLDIGVTDTSKGSAPFMVLEWLDGKTLGEVLAERRGHGGSTAQEAVALLRPVFDALAFAHDEGIAHRDIKPANIMRVQGRRGSSLRVLDFGIAKLMGEGEEAGTGHTRTSTALSAYSPHYAAPEQVSRTRTGPWTDVHALGLILTEALIGQRAYRSREMADLFQEVLSPQRPTPAKFGMNVGALEPVLARALAFKPEDRYRSAGEMLTAIDAALAAMGPGVPVALGPADGTAVFPDAYDSMRAASLPPQTTLSSAVANTPVAAEVRRPWTMIALGAVGLAVLVGGGAAVLTRGHASGAPAAADRAVVRDPMPPLPTGARVAPSTAPVAATVVPSAPLPVAPAVPTAPVAPVLDTASTPTTAAGVAPAAPARGHRVDVPGANAPGSPHAPGDHSSHGDPPTRTHAAHEYHLD